MSSNSTKYNFLKDMSQTISCKSFNINHMLLTRLCKNLIWNASSPNLSTLSGSKINEF